MRFAFENFNSAARRHSQPRYYNLLPDKGWEIDLVQVESLIDQHTKAIVLNNPSNPTGAVYDKTHLENFLKVCDKYGITVIADEIYGRTSAFELSALS